MSFRRRTFPEVLDNLLTDIAGGVAAEAHPFPPPETGTPFTHRLQQPPAAQVVSVYGSRDGQPRLFRAGADYRLRSDGQTLEWPEGAELPDEGTLVYVNYLRASAQPALTDLQVGSIVRTISESVGLEIARLYAQVEGVYRSGFVDTAEGAALDNVVALLGIERVTGGRAAGEIVFARTAGTPGSVSIPAGTRVLTADGSVEYETTESVTLAPGQNAIRVIARDRESNDPLPADSLSVLPTPIEGIAGVTNPAPTALETQDETDAELRTRAKNFLHGSERATLGALKEAVARQQISADIDERPGVPGYVDVTPHVETLSPERQQRLLTALDEARPAGVIVTLKAPVPPRRVDLEMLLVTAPGLTEPDLRAAQRAVRAGVEDYFARLPVRDPGSVNQIVGRALSVPQVRDLRLISARVEGDPTERLNQPTAGQIDIGGFPTVLGALHIADPSLPTRLSVVVAHPENLDPPDTVAIAAALAGALTYLNTRSAAEPAAPEAQRTLGYGKLLLAVPLPGKEPVALQALDAVAPGAIALPDENAIAPYRVIFTLTLESGLSRILERATDAPYRLTPFERLSLAGVERRAEAPGA